MGDTFEGKEHDKTILEAQDVRFAEPVVGYIDLAYLDLKIENMRNIIPHKKPKGGELTKKQKRST